MRGAFISPIVRALMPKLHPHIGVPAFQRRVLSTLATIAISLVVLGLNVPHLSPSSPQDAQKAAFHAMQVPPVLSVSDAALYRQAFALQEKGRMDDADAAAAGTGDSLLKGVLLGERYLAPGHEPNFSELALWLARYGDHAQAAELYAIARQRAPADADFLTEPRMLAPLKAFSNRYGANVLSEEKQWISGLAAFRRHDMVTAAAHFKALLNADEDALSDEDRAAVAFWTYRAVSALGVDHGARDYLAMAAAERPGFYSLLARHILGTQAAKSGETDAAKSEDFLQKGAIRRAIALRQIGQDALAEKELRTLFPGSTEEDRKRLVDLARALDLPAAQMRMAVAAAYDASASDTFYPLPRWTPTLGYHVEPALIFAIMRQESGFNPHARSASGAMGLMQLMPDTAHAMAADARLKMSPEPAVNMTLGQHYLERLMDTASVSDNLILLLGAYNGGPASVAGWQKNVSNGDDPLLFIESIKCAETRDYIERVMSNYWVYSEMLSGVDNASIAALARNEWPHYERSENQTVIMVSRLNTGGSE